MYMDTKCAKQEFGWLWVAVKRRVLYTLHWLLYLDRDCIFYNAIVYILGEVRLHNNVCAVAL